MHPRNLLNDGNNHELEVKRALLNSGSYVCTVWYTLSTFSCSLAFSLEDGWEDSWVLSLFLGICRSVSRLHYVSSVEIDEWGRSRALGGCND